MQCRTALCIEKSLYDISYIEIVKGRSPLALAVKQNKKDMIEHLIHIGAPTSSQDKNVCYSLIK